MKNLFGEQISDTPAITEKSRRFAMSGLRLITAERDRLTNCGNCRNFGTIPPCEIYVESGQLVQHHRLIVCNEWRHKSKNNCLQ